VRQAQAPSSGALDLSYMSPYAGKSLILIMDGDGTAGFLDTFNIDVSTRARPSNDTCQSAQPIGLGVVSASNAGASNTASHLADMPFYARGPERFYQVTLSEGDVFHASVTADWIPRTYLLSSCNDLDQSWVAFDDPYEPARELTYTVPPGEGGSYILAVDGDTPSNEFLDADGHFSLHTSLGTN
jgi:hypothetical protein